MFTEELGLVAVEGFEGGAGGGPGEGGVGGVTGVLVLFVDGGGVEVELEVKAGGFEGPGRRIFHLAAAISSTQRNSGSVWGEKSAMKDWRSWLKLGLSSVEMMLTLAVREWVMALRATLALPAAERGPWVRAPLRRAAWFWSLERLRM